MPIPGYSLIAPPEFITTAEAVEMVVDRFKSSACTETEAYAWLSEKARQGTLNLTWTDKSPEYLGGLHLTGEDVIFIPGLPGAQVLDELDWGAGELRRRLRIPESIHREAKGIDPWKLTCDELRARDRELLARYSCDIFEPGECATEVLKYPFKVKRACLVAILDMVPIALETRPAAQTASVARLSQNAAECHSAKLPVKKPDPRTKREAMIEGLEKAVATGGLQSGKRATLKTAYRTMLAALGHQEAPTGMGEDAFAKHCKQWLREHGMYD